VEPQEKKDARAAKEQKEREKIFMGSVSISSKNVSGRATTSKTR
jgi:hypothetical protein